MEDLSKSARKEDFFGKALFDIEHALGMYATGYCTIPAEGIYDKQALEPLMHVLESCHIYLIGYTPVIEFVDAKQDANQLGLKFTVRGQEHIVTYELHEGLLLRQEGELYYLEDASGTRGWPNMLEAQSRLSSQSGTVSFEVKYIGQAYGQDGSRNAVDRLLKHETLQKISLMGVPDGFKLSLLMLEIQPNNQLFTLINPFAQKKDDNGERIKSGLDKLFNTTEQERVSLYEAALIRYFYPKFNKEFKDSFPSTNLKILQDCYEKDFSAVVAEINIDGLPFRLCSEQVKPAPHHIAKHHLHKAQERRVFFGIE